MNCTRAAQGMPKSVKNAVIALLDIDLRKSKMNFGVQVSNRPGLFAVCFLKPGFFAFAARYSRMHHR
jgi:hypothetical protein